MARARRNLSRAMHESGGRIGRASLPWRLVKDSNARPPTPPPPPREMFSQDPKPRARSGKNLPLRGIGDYFPCFPLGRGGAARGGSHSVITTTDPDSSPCSRNEYLRRRKLRCE
jgi:hypothetical protein